MTTAAMRDGQTPAPSFLTVVKTELMWATHNLIAHPVSEITHWLGYIWPALRDLGLAFHDITVPPHAPNTGRG